MLILHSCKRTCACSLAGAQHHVAPNSKHPGADPSLNLNQFNHNHIGFDLYRTKTSLLPIFSPRIHSVAFLELFSSLMGIVAHAIFPLPEMNEKSCNVSTYSSSSHSYRVHTLNHLLHSHRLVAKVDYNTFQFQPFRMWRSHAAATKIMMVETTSAFVK